MIEKLREFQIGQYIREEGPQSHQKKSGTPTMGGVLICISILVPTLLWSDLSNPLVWLVMLSTLAFGAIGFADDYIKVVHRRNQGLTARAKLGLQLLVSAGGGADAGADGAARDVFDAADGAVCEELPAGPGVATACCTFRICGGWPFLPFVIFVMLVISFSSNAVNLTDGLDGLAIGCTIIAAGALTVLTYVSGHVVFSRVPGAAADAAGERVDRLLRGDGGGEYRLPLVQRASGGDLYGRCGSLALGGAIGTVAVVIKQELLLPFIGGVFILEALSVMLQVGSYKLRKGSASSRWLRCTITLS